MSDPVVLDTSALLCLLRGERGSERVLAYLSRAWISAINLSEVYAVLATVGGSEARIAQAIDGLHLRIDPFDGAQARAVGMLGQVTRDLALSFADRSCLVLARQRGAIALTTNRNWSELPKELGVTVEFIG